jgi:hypothetical protein
LEALEAARGDCGVMCENVFAVLTADEAVTMQLNPGKLLKIKKRQSGI